MFRWLSLCTCLLLLCLLSAVWLTAPHQCHECELYIHVGKPVYFSMCVNLWWRHHWCMSLTGCIVEKSPNYCKFAVCHGFYLHLNGIRHGAGGSPNIHMCTHTMQPSLWVRKSTLLLFTAGWEKVLWNGFEPVLSLMSWWKCEETHYIDVMVGLFSCSLWYIWDLKQMCQVPYVSQWALVWLFSALSDVITQNYKV